MAKFRSLAFIIGFLLSADAFAVDASTLSYTTDSVPTYSNSWSQTPKPRVRRTRQAVQSRQENTDFFSSLFRPTSQQVVRKTRGDRIDRVAKQDRPETVKPKREKRVVEQESPSIFSSSNRLRPGEACTSRDRDPLKCMACVINGEDDKSRVGALAVAGNVQERVARRFRGRNVCEVVHADGQYRGAWKNLPTGNRQLALIEKWASEGLNVPGNGFLGFRSYPRPKYDSIQIGTNHFTKRAEDEGLKDQIQQQEAGRFQTAELQTGTTVN